MNNQPKTIRATFRPDRNPKKSFRGIQYDKYSFGETVKHGRVIADGEPIHGILYVAKNAELPDTIVLERKED